MRRLGGGDSEASNETVPSSASRMSRVAKDLRHSRASDARGGSCRWQAVACRVRPPWLEGQGAEGSSAAPRASIDALLACVMGLTFRAKWNGQLRGLGRSWANVAASRRWVASAAASGLRAVLWQRADACPGGFGLGLGLCLLEASFARSPQTTTVGGACSGVP